MNRSVLKLLRAGRTAPCTFPPAPHGDIVESEFIPPAIQHCGIETHDTFLRHARRRRHKPRKPGVYNEPLRSISTRQQMPQRQRITLARLTENSAEIARALLRRVVFKIETRQCGTELRRCIFEVRRARAGIWLDGSYRARRDERLVPFQFESNPALRRSHHACARIVDLQCVSTSKIDRGPRRRIDDELPRRRPDKGMNHAMIERNAL